MSVIVQHGFLLFNYNAGTTMTSIVALPGVTFPSNASELQALIDTVTALVETKLATSEGLHIAKVTILSIGGVSVLRQRLVRTHLGRKL